MGIVSILSYRVANVCRWTEATPSPPCGAHGTAGSPSSPYTSASADLFHREHVVRNQLSLKLVLGGPNESIAAHIQLH